MVPEEFRPRLLNMMLQGTSIRSLATVLPMGAPVTSLPAIRDATHADGTTFGGVDFNWLEVNDEIKRIPARLQDGHVERPGIVRSDGTPEHADSG